MKLELIGTKPGMIIFRDCEKSLFAKSRKVHSCYERLYFMYNNHRIYLAEFVPQRDGTHLYFS